MFLLRIRNLFGYMERLEFTPFHMISLDAIFTGRP